MAASAPPMVIAGSTRWASEPEPETGSQPSSIAKNKMRIGPSAKFGNDNPSNETKLSARSRSEEHTSELHADFPNHPEPETGSQPSSIAKNKMRIGPSAKFGNDNPSNETKLSARSSQRLRRSADRTPAGIANASATSNAASVSSMVAG